MDNAKIKLSGNLLGVVLEKNVQYQGVLPRLSDQLKAASRPQLAMRRSAQAFLKTSLTNDRQPSMTSPSPARVAVRRGRFLYQVPETSLFFYGMVSYHEPQERCTPRNRSIQNRRNAVGAFTLDAPTRCMTSGSHPRIALHRPQCWKM